MLINKVKKMSNFISEKSWSENLKIIDELNLVTNFILEQTI